MVRPEAHPSSTYIAALVSKQGAFVVSGSPATQRSNASILWQALQRGMGTLFVGIGLRLAARKV